MHKICLTTTVWLTLTAASAAGAADLNLDQCTFAEAPVVADGSTATEDQMAQSGREVREYVGAMQAALACIDQEEQRLGEEITDEQRAEITAKYNTGYDQLSAIANEYNDQVRAFKER